MSWLGPGFVTGASDDDPSGIAVFSQTGAQYGLQLLWLAPFVFPLMICIQEMSARIGVVTGRGIIAILHDRYPPYAVWLVGLVTIPAVTINVGADLLAMGAVLHMLLPGVPTPVFSISCAFLVLTSLLAFRYERMASVLKWAALVLLVYVFVPFFVHQQWSEVFRSALVPHVEFNARFIVTMAAFLGTNISAYLLFWEASMEVEDRVRFGRAPVNLRRVRSMQKDNATGMALAAIIMFFVVWACGSTLHRAGVTSITTVNDAAIALRPIAGQAASLLFAVGILASGFIAVPVLAGACGYIASEAFGFPGGMRKSPRQAPAFYAVIFCVIVLSLAINLTRIGAIQALIFSALVYAVMAPAAIFAIMRICNDPRVMGTFTNGLWSNVFGAITFVTMTVASVVLLVTLVHPL